VIVILLVILFVKLCMVVVEREVTAGQSEVH
jgi:hypothetical protein